LKPLYATTIAPAFAALGLRFVAALDVFTLHLQRDS
jgi:hypothetical protein